MSGRVVSGRARFCRVRLGLLAAAIGAPLLLGAQGPSDAERAGPREIPVFPAAGMVDFVGINTHVAYTDSRYADPDRVVEALRHLGVRLVRDSVPNPAIAGNGWYNYPKVAAAGIRFNFLVGSGEVDVPDAIARLTRFEQDFPGSVAAVEGPNEYNNWPFAYEGRTGNDAAVAFQDAVFAGLRASPVLARVPLYNLTTWPPAFGRYDALTIHVYPKHGSQLREWLPHEIAKFSHDGRFFPATLTEIGWYTLPKKIGWGGVDPPTQARLTLNALLAARRAGFSSIFLYELLDAYDDPDGVEVGRHFGLFTADYAPKPAAEAVRRLMAAVADEGAGARVQARHRLEAGARIDALAFAKTSGETVLAVWDERAVWDPEALAPVAVPDVDARLVLDGLAEIVSVTDAVTGEALPRDRDASGGLVLAMRGNPVLVVAR